MSRYRYDKILIAVTLLLVLFGIVMVFSASFVVSYQESGTEYHFFQRQASFAVLGLVLLGLAMTLDYHILKTSVYPILGVSLLLLVLVLIPGVGLKINNARRWIGFMGLNFQPSELAKLALVIYLSYSLTKKDDKIKTLKVGYLPHLLLMLIMGVLIWEQPDFGAAITIGIIAFIMLFVAGTRLSYLLATVLATAPFIYLGVVNVEYRFKRIIAFLNPWEDPTGSGYHIIQSFLAFGSGGLTGTGLGQGTQKLFYLPYAYSDFIFAVVGEELGFVGASFLIAAYGVLAVRGFRAARRAPDLFGTYLAVGITCLITVGAILNTGVVTGLFPTKGMTLPFISYGGSSLVVNMLAAGILINVSGQGVES